MKLKDLRNRPEWNGQYAEILRQVETADDDRFEVRRLSVTNGSTAAIKRVNLDPIPDEDTVKVCRMSCSGEEHFLGGFRQTVRWPKAILQDSRHYPSVSCPIAAKLGFPLRIAKVRPRTVLRSRPDYDNQWVTWMMIDLVSGFAPSQWQGNIGPVVVWREDGGDVSSDDMCLLNDYLDGLLDQYSEGPGSVVPDRDINPSVWSTFKMRAADSYEDINI